MKVLVEVPDLPQDCTKSHAVASYLRALIRYQALRRELATAAADVARCKKVLASRVHAEDLMAEAHGLRAKLHIETDIS